MCDKNANNIFVFNNMTGCKYSKDIFYDKMMIKNDDNNDDNNDDIIYWNTNAGLLISSQSIKSYSIFWKIIPNFELQDTQSLCGIASIITIFNSMKLMKKPNTGIYNPHHYFTETNFFDKQSVNSIITLDTVNNSGITVSELSKVINEYDITSGILYGDQVTSSNLRYLFKKILNNYRCNKYIIVNYYRPTLNQEGFGHWSVLAAYDDKNDRVLLLDVAKYKYNSCWVKTDRLLKATNTVDNTSGLKRGLVVIYKN